MAARLSGGGGFVIYLLAAAVLVFVLAPLVVVVALSFSFAIVLCAQRSTHHQRFHRAHRPQASR